MFKRGDISISFEMIFSIIIIIAIIGAASYALVYFLDFKKCGEIGLFYNNFQKSIDYAWNADIVNTLFDGTLPSSIERVCVGNLTLADMNGVEYKAFRNYVLEDANLFLYPPAGACDISYKKLKHVNITEFECTSVRGGKASFSLNKREDEALVRVCDVSDTSCQNMVPPLVDDGDDEPEFNVPREICQRASSANLCDGLVLVYDSNYKLRCCSQYQLCC